MQILSVLTGALYPGHSLVLWMLSRTKAPFLSERLNLIVPRVTFGDCLSTALCLATHCLGAFRELLSRSYPRNRSAVMSTREAALWTAFGPGRWTSLRL